MNKIILLGTLMKKLNLSKIIYNNKICKKVLFLCINDKTIPNVKTAMNLLLEVAPKPKGSGVAKNKVCQIKKYDLKIILPIYNAELYIEECLMSLLSQKTKYSFYIVAVNDGSSDSTSQILQKYKSHSNLKIVNQTNSGVAIARNNALKKLDSEYIMFVDSDDRLADNAVEILLDAAYQNNSEIVEGSYHYFRKNKILKSYIHDNKFNVEAFWNIRSFPWGKVMKSSLFENVKFPEGYWFEDTNLMYLVFPNCNNATTLNNIVYWYRYNYNGLTVSSKKKLKSVDTYWILEKMLEDMDALNISKDQKIYEFTLRQIYNNFRRTKYLDESLKKSIFVLSSQLLQRYFPGFKTRNNHFKELERSLRDVDYKNYFLFCSLF